MKLIDKDALVAKIERGIKINKECMLGLRNLDYYQGKVDAFNDTISFIDTLEVKEVSEELAETYMQVFEKKFPILPTLKGKQLDKFKNFLNRCQQIFGLQEFSIRPVQAKLFEKLVLLWAVWGAENLQGIGQVEGESDEVKEGDLEKYYHEFLQKEWFGNPHVRTVSEMMAFTAKHFFELGLQVSNKAQKGELYDR